MLDSCLVLDIGRILTPADKIDKEKAVPQENGQEGEDPVGPFFYLKKLY